ncbi:dienelactone hydrolase family protein [Paraburkholderia sp. SIMBA_049]
MLPLQSEFSLDRTNRLREQKSRAARVQADETGRPGPDTAYRKFTRHRFDVEWTIDEEAIAYDHRSDGMNPLITNDPCHQPRCLRPTRISFYGGRVMHEHLRELRSIACPVQYHVGELDTHILPDHVKAVQDTVDSMPNAPIYTYEGAQHGFFNSRRENVFDREAFVSADHRMFELLKARLP